MTRRSGRRRIVLIYLERYFVINGLSYAKKRFAVLSCCAAKMLGVDDSQQDLQNFRSGSGSHPAFY